MKISNNALNFLLAQYRAIFKRAYVKGIASAVLLTAGLAAGQAQAAETVFSDPKLLPGSDDTITITNTGSSTDDTQYKLINIQSGTFEQFNGELIIKGGTPGSNAQSNYIAGNQDTNISGKGKLTINGANTTDGLQIFGNGGNVTIDIGTVSVQNGLLKLYDKSTANKSGTISLAADTITIGNGTGSAVVTLTGASDKGLTLGRSSEDGVASTITVNKGGVLILNDASTDTGATANNTIEGASLNVAEGGVLLTSSGTKNVINSDNWEIASGAFHVVSGAATTEKFTGYTGDIHGNLLVGSNGTLVLENLDREADPDHGVEAIDANVTVHEGANVQLTGTLSISGGTLTVNEGAKLYATTNATTANSGSIVITKDTDNTTEGTLAIDSSTLSQFLTGKDGTTQFTYKAIEGTDNNYSLATGDSNAASGGLVLSGGRVEFTDDTQVKLSDFAFKASNNTQAAAGVIVVHSGSANTFAADEILIESTLKSGGDSLNSGSNIAIEAANLTLGNTTTTSTADLGFTKANTQNLTVLAKTGEEFVLKNEINLDVTKGEGESGSIKGDMVVGDGGSIKVLHGTFESNYALTLNSGSLTVTNADLDDEGNVMDTKLTLTGDLTLTAGDAESKIVVDGQNKKAETVLDIQNAEFKLVSGASTAASIAVQSGGTLVTKALQIKEMLQDFDGSNSGTTVLLHKGTIEVVNDLTLDASTQLTSGALATSDGKITFHNSDGGTLKVDGALTLTGVTGLDIGGKSEIVADTLTINNEDTSKPNTYKDSVLESGKYLAQSVLRSADKTKNINISGAQVFLGDFNKIEPAIGDPYYEAVEGSESGRIDVNLQLTKAGSGLTVQNGSWTGQSVTVTAGDLNVGLRDTLGFDGTGVKHDVNGDAIGATLTLTTLSVSGGTATVAEGSTLNVNNFTVAQKDASTKGLTVYGTTTVNGNKTTSGTPAEIKYGVDIGAGSIEVADGGLLQFKGDALEALQISNTSGTNGYIDAGASYKAGSITVDAGGEVLFDFDSGTSLSAAQLRELRSDIFVGNGETVSDGDSGPVTLVEGAINLGQADIAEIQADKDGNYSWKSLAQYSDIIANYTTNDLKSAIVYGVDAGAPVRGHYGALKSDTLNEGTSITIVGDTSLNNAAAQNDIFALGNQGGILGLNASNAHVELNNGGQIGTVALDGNSTLVINGDQGITAPAETIIKSIDGADGSEAEFVIGKTTVSENSDIGNLVTRAGSDVTFKGTLTVGTAGTPADDDVETVLAGTSNTFEGEATFNNSTEIQGAATFNDGVTFGNWTGIYANTAVTGGATFSADAEIGGNSTFTADSIELTTNSTPTTSTGIHFVVGEEDYIEDGQTHEGSTGYLQADAFKLAGNTLVVDPSYDRETSIAYVKNFTDGDSKKDAGIFSGKLIAGQNAALIVGTSKDVYDDAMAVIKGYQNSRGALIQDEVGSLVYIGDQLSAEAGSRIIIDSQRTQDQIFDDPTQNITGALSDGSYRGDYVVNGTTVQPNVDADLFLGVNTVMVVSDNILDKKDNVAVHFQSNDAYIMAEKAEGKEHAAKIVLDGNGFLDSRKVTLFTDTGTGSSTANGVKVLGDKDIRVETLNGVMYFMLNAGKEVTGGTLNLDTTKIDTAFLGATDESRNLLFAYTSQTANWEEYFDEANLAKVDNDPTKVKREQLHGDLASEHIAYYDATATGTNGVVLTDAALADGKYKAEDFIAVPLLDEDGKQITDKETGKPLGTVYHRAYNDLLEAIARNTNGAATDSAALQGVFGGAAQAALLAARTSQEAVAGRTGVGASSSALTFADNGQGAGLWVNPIYVSQDSDGFEVGNKDYGVDIDLYGVALGGDYTHVLTIKKVPKGLRTA